MACRSLEMVEVAMVELESLGTKGSLSALQLDVTDAASIEGAVAHVQQHFGRLDVLINNAASSSMDGDIETRFRLCLETNVAGPAMVAPTFRPLLLKSHNPYSICLGSGVTTIVRNAAEKPPAHGDIRNGDAYLVSKAALNMLAVLEAENMVQKA